MQNFLVIVDVVPFQIKFVVDGNWRIDPQRESVTKGTIENNILRVDR